MCDFRKVETPTQCTFYQYDSNTPSLSERNVQNICANDSNCAKSFYSGMVFRLNENNCNSFVPLTTQCDDEFQTKSDQKICKIGWGVQDIAMASPLYDKICKRCL